MSFTIFDIAEIWHRSQVSPQSRGYVPDLISLVLSTFKQVCISPFWIFPTWIMYSIFCFLDDNLIDTSSIERIIPILLKDLDFGLVNKWRCRESYTPGDGYRNSVSLSKYLTQHISCIWMLISYYFYNKLVNMTLGGTEMLYGTKLSGRLTTNERGTTNMEEGGGRWHTSDPRHGGPGLGRHSPHNIWLWKPMVLSFMIFYNKWELTLGNFKISRLSRLSSGRAEGQ